MNTILPHYSTSLVRVFTGVRRHVLFGTVSAVAAVTGPGMALGQPLEPQLPVLDGTYLFALLPGIGPDLERGGAGLVIFDVDDDFRLLRRIELPHRSETGPEIGKGIAASADTGLLYLMMTNRLVALDSSSGEVRWQQAYDGDCCGRGEISPGSDLIYLPALEAPKWYVVSAFNGALITIIDVPAVAHNTMFSPLGDTVYLSPSNETLYLVDSHTTEVTREIGPFGARVRPWTINGAETRAFATIDGLLGFEIANLETGRVIDRVVVPDLPCAEGGGHETCAHGIALTPDQTQLWLADGVNNRPGGYLHVFDATVEPPAFLESVATRAPVDWITCSIDGTRIYPSSGDVVDRASMRVVNGLLDEEGRPLESEKMIEVRFADGVPVAIGGQWCNGTVGLEDRLQRHVLEQAQR